jgi:hypothetical protein
MDDLSWSNAWLLTTIGDYYALSAGAHLSLASMRTPFAHSSTQPMLILPISPRCAPHLRTA